MTPKTGSNPYWASDTYQGGPSGPPLFVKAARPWSGDVVTVRKLGTSGP